MAVSKGRKGQKTKSRARFQGKVNRRNAQINNIKRILKEDAEKRKLEEDAAKSDVNIDEEE